jgi:hypothetical protein
MAQSTKHSTRLPDFIAVGPPRTGTTWLHRALEGHVGLPSGVKETNFFDVYYDSGIDWYLSHFQRCNPDLPLGEVCTYFAYPQARARIQTHMPACKIIVSFRDPVARAYSHYKYLRSRAYTKAGFEEFLATRPHANESNRYAFHLADWFARFGRERVMVSFYDDLKSNPQGFLDRICDFIAIDRIALANSAGLGDSVNSFEGPPRSHKLAQNARHLSVMLKRNRFYRIIDLLGRAGIWDYCYGRGDPYPLLTPDEDTRVRAKFLSEIEALEKLLGRDLSAWKSPRGADSSRRQPDRAAAG